MVMTKPVKYPHSLKKLFRHLTPKGFASCSCHSFVFVILIASFLR